MSLNNFGFIRATKSTLLYHTFAIFLLAIGLLVAANYGCLAATATPHGIVTPPSPPTPQPPAVVVTPGSIPGGDLGNNPTLTNASQCSAVVNNGPVTNDEVDVEGPHWSWDISWSFLDDGLPATDPAHDPSATGNAAYTKSPHSPDTDSTCDYGFTFYAPGDYVVTLTATATYSVTNKTGPNAGQTTTVTFSGSGNPGIDDPDASTYMSGDPPVTAATVVAANALVPHDTPAPPQAAPAKVSPVTAPWEYDPDTENNPMVWRKVAPPSIMGPIQACAGETITINLAGQDSADRKRRKGSNGAWTAIPGAGPYKVHLTASAGAAFDSPSGASSKDVPGGTDGSSIKTGNVSLVVSNTWTGTTPITVTATLQDLATDGTADPDAVAQWTVSKRSGPAPTGMHQVAGPPAGEWQTDSATYEYKMDPVPPHYQGQTVQESFGAISSSLQMADLTVAFKTAHPDLTSPDQVISFLFNSGDNNSFVIYDNDAIIDSFSGFSSNNNDVSMFTDQAKTSGITWTIAQTYSVCGVIIGNYTVERQYKGGVISIRRP